MEGALVTSMDRRTFLKAGATAGLWAYGGVRWSGWWRQPDLVLRRAVVFDGTGAPGVEADVAVVGDRIHAVGRIREKGLREFDLAGKALSPGFIDIHTHADLLLLANPWAENLVLQGITLQVGGQCGSSPGPWSEEEAIAVRNSYRLRFGLEVDFHDLGGFFRALERTPPSVNAACMVGHGTVRAAVVGMENRPATPSELQQMRSLVREALEQGAVGLSSGLEYTPGSFAGLDELIEVARVLRGTGYPYATHMRNEDDAVLAAVEEALHVARSAGVPVQISHLKAQGERNWWKAPLLLEVIEEAFRQGLEVHFDRYPYIAYSTGLANLFPPEARAGGNRAFVRRLQDPLERPALEAYARRKVAQLGSWDAVQISGTSSSENAWIHGKRLGEAAREVGEDPFELLVKLLVQEGGNVGMIGFGMSEESTSRILAHPLAMIGSDGSVYALAGPLSEGNPHPRSYGAFPRVLGRYVREQGIFSLETAVHKMTGMPAAKLRLSSRGVIRPGAFADLVAFDPAGVSDRATFAEPRRYPDGIDLVMVNGVVTALQGEMTGALAGRPVRGDGWRGKT